MGIAFVIIFYFIALTGLAAIGSLVFRASAKSLTNSFKDHAKRFVLAATLFPFVCEVFAGIWFVSYAITNYAVFHRDPGLGDSWETPLPNGYALMMIDATDQGTVYNPKTQSDGSVVERNDAVFGVRQLQVRDNLILGSRDSGYFSRIGADSNEVDTWFELDTAARRTLNSHLSKGSGKKRQLRAFHFNSVNFSRSFRITEQHGSTIWHLLFSYSRLLPAF